MCTEVLLDTRHCRKCAFTNVTDVLMVKLQFNAECHGICQRLDELIKSRSLHFNQIYGIWTSICKYQAAKVNLNMNPACSAHLCVLLMEQMRGFVY